MNSQGIRFLRTYNIPYPKVPTYSNFQRCFVPLYCIANTWFFLRIPLQCRMMTSPIHIHYSSSFPECRRDFIPHTYLHLLPHVPPSHLGCEGVLFLRSNGEFAIMISPNLIPSVPLFFSFPLLQLLPPLATLALFPPSLSLRRVLPRPLRRRRCPSHRQSVRPPG